LSSLPFLKENNSKDITSFIRLDHTLELFYDGNVDQHLVIDIGRQRCNVHYQNENLIVELSADGRSSIFRIDPKLTFRLGKNNSYLPSILKYKFRPNTRFKEATAKHLAPPFGYNLLQIIERNNELKKKRQPFFEASDLSPVFGRNALSLEIKDPQKKDVAPLPYHLLGDSLQ